MLIPFFFFLLLLHFYFENIYLFHSGQCYSPKSPHCSVFLSIITSHLGPLVYYYLEPNGAMCIKKKQKTKNKKQKQQQNQPTA